MNRNWYAVYTKTKCEIKVVALLTKKGIENFCPHKRMIVGHGNKKRMIYEPLFPSFVFVFISEAEMNVVKRTNDVINFVFWLGKPAIIKTNEVENIAHFNGLYYNILVEKSPVNAAGMVRIISETGYSHSFSNGTPFKTNLVKLTLPSLGYTIYAETSTQDTTDPLVHNTYTTPELV